jgi:hypothetical protein
MGELPSAAEIHVVQGRPWKDALIKVLAPGCPYQPWHYDEGIDAGDAVVVVLDTDPASVLSGVGIVGSDGDVDDAIGSIDPHFRRNGLLDLGTLQMLTDVQIPTRTGPLYHHRSPGDVAAVLGDYYPATSDALFGHTSLVAGRVLLASGGSCRGCSRELELLGEDARDCVHIHTADRQWFSGGLRNERGVADWPAALCTTCHTRMRRDGFTSFLDFRFSLHPRCPSCSAQRSRTTMYGMPVFGPVEEPWIAAMGCCVEPWDWQCDVCGHEW